ncbi:MAG: MDR family MFS transporter [Eggerthellaceae bacterium]
MGLTRQQTTMVVVLLAGAFLVVLNQTLLTPALPTIMSHLQVNATTVQWLTSGYALVEAVIIPLNAYLIGRFPTRRLFIGGMSLFAAGSALCAFAPSFSFLLAGRIIQACATGVVMPMVFALILLIFPKEGRGVGMGLVGLIISFAPAMGPSISGVLVDGIGWRALFVLVVLLALVVVIAATIALKSFEGFDRTTFDALSVVVLTIGMVCLLYGIATSTSSEMVLVPIALIVVGIAVLYLFIRRQLKLDNPILQMRVLKHREFFTIVIIITLLEGVLIGGSVLFPLYVQNALQASATVSGLVMLPGALIGAFFGLLAGKLFDKFGVRGISLVGAGVLLAGGICYVLLGSASSLVAACIAYTIVTLGIQALITPLNTWGINSLPNKSLPHGNAIIATMEQVGSSLGTAFVVSLTALSGLFVSQNASAIEQSYMGCHLAFIGMLVLIVIIALLIVIFVRDKKAAIATDIDAVPGVDRPWLVSDIMNEAPAILSSSATIRDAIVLLNKADTSGIPLVDQENQVVGFLSDGDILKYLARQESSQSDGVNYVVLLESESFQRRIKAVYDLNVMQLATRSVVSVDAGDNAERAFKTLSEKRIKKAPVVQDGRLVGTLSRRNIIRALEVMG